MKQVIAEKDEAGIAGVFLQEMAARYDLGELRGMLGQWTKKISAPRGTAHTTHATHTVELQIAPRGQLAAIVKELTVKVEVIFQTVEEQTHILGVLHFRYAHHDGGSNGNSQEFVVLCEDRFASHSYAGCVNRRLAYMLKG